MASKLQVYHHSGDCRFRQKPFPIATGEKIIFRIQTDGAQTLSVCIRFYREGTAWTQEMKRQGDLWEVCFTAPKEAGVIWYYFILETEEGRLFYGLPEGETAGAGMLFEQEPASFQLTVYEQGFTTPDWMKNGVLYQIFPDRYCRAHRGHLTAGAAYREGMGRRTLCHEAWAEEVLYRPLEGESDYDPCDFYGGDLLGIEQSLPALRDAGITVLYLNPICEAASNHRYDTADYHKVDPILGTNEDFARLTKRAAELGIRVLLDGVYSHTGADSVYFNRYGSYAVKGAYQGPESPYYSWYSFGADREDYRCWWNFRSLPEVNEHDPSWQEFVITGERSVLSEWLKLGAAGFRLDVADELPDEVISLMRRTIKEKGSQYALLGEVWEDATIKESYGRPRRYALGAGLDSVMNYPFRNACVDFLLSRSDAFRLKQFFLTQQVNYPPQMLYALMNLLSSHDISRIRTVLGLGGEPSGLSREEQASVWLTPEQDAAGAGLQRLAVWLAFSVPGLPAVYYGDEYGMEGLRDPFNRRSLQKKDVGMAAVYRQAARLRQEAAVLRTGFAQYHALDEEVFAVHRFLLEGRDFFGEERTGRDMALVWNRADREKQIVLPFFESGEGVGEEQLPKLQAKRYLSAAPREGGEVVPMADNRLELILPPQSVLCYWLNEAAD